MKPSNKIESQNILLINKPQGQTPLQVIDLVKQHMPEYRNSKIGYAGRLDPMADGLLLLLLGEENKKRKFYEELPKQYTFTVLFGIATDTYDLLGRITNVCNKMITEHELKLHAKNFIGTFEQPYPPYSSMHVHGKPLYYYARENKLNEISLPTKKVTVDQLSYVSLQTIHKDELNKTIIERITKVKGDFRQKDILSCWATFFNQTKLDSFSLASFVITCSSGTYVRSIAQKLGEQVNSCALAYSITRTAIGSFDLNDVLPLKK